MHDDPRSHAAAPKSGTHPVLSDPLRAIAPGPSRPPAPGGSLSPDRAAVITALEGVCAQLDRTRRALDAHVERIAEHREPSTASDPGVGHIA